MMRKQSCPIDRNSTLRIEEGGAINCWRGMEPHRNAFVYANAAQFNDNTQRGISITRNALVNLKIIVKPPEMEIIMSELTGLALSKQILDSI